MSEQRGNNQNSRTNRFNGTANGTNSSNTYGYNQNQGYGYQGRNYNQNAGNYNNARGYNGNNGAYNGNNGSFNGNYNGNGNGANPNYGQYNPNGQMPYSVQIPWDKFELRRKKHRNPICAFLLGVGSVITFARNLVFNLIFLGIIALVFMGHYIVSSLQEHGLSMSQAALEQMEGSSLPAQVLYFDLSGSLSEAPFSPNQFDSMQRELEFMFNGTYSHELVAIENALNLVSGDPDIKKVLINIDNMAPLTLSVAERIGKAMEHARVVNISQEQRAKYGSASSDHSSGFSSDGDTMRREVIVMGTNFSQAAYVLAAHADKVILDPLGAVDLRGIALSSLYFKDTLEQFHLTPYIFRAGRFKSAVEPFILSGMSPEVRRSYQAIAAKSWEIYTDALTSRSAIKNVTNILPDAATYVKWVEEFNGDRAAMQKAQGLVDEVMPLERYLRQLSTEVNVDADHKNRPAIITYQDYLLRYHYLNTGNGNVGSLSAIDIPRSLQHPQSEEEQPSSAPQRILASTALTSASTVLTNTGSSTLTSASTALTSASTALTSASTALTDSGASTALSSSTKVAAPNLVAEESLLDQLNEAQKQRERRTAANKRRSTGAGEVAVIYGIGEIRESGERITDFTYDNIAPLFDEAADDPNIQAVVLYLNSPGGSVNASEKIRRAIAEFQMRTLKPVVVSMNGTAASGAYWLGSQAERIFATKSTLTGSIGVFGIALGAHNLLNRYGAYQDGVATNELAVTPIGEEMPTTQQELLNMSVEHTYRQFLELVAQNRGLKVNDYDLFAEGQVFLADEAKIVGLVDEIGDLDDAISYAGKLAMLDPETMRVKHLVPSSAGNLGNFGLVFGLAHAYLPDNVTYALLKLHETMQLTKEPHQVSMQALTPVQSPEL